MARTPSLDRSEAESMLGPRGHLNVNIDNRSLVRKWLVSCGVPASTVGGLTMATLAAAYNDASDAVVGGLISQPTAPVPDEMPAAPRAPIAPRAAMPAAPADEMQSALATLAKAFGGNVSEERIEALIESKLERAMSAIPTVRIEVARHDGTTHEVDGYHHPKFATLVKMATARQHDGFVPGIFVAGEASSGKTTGCKMLAKALGLSWYFNGAISMPHEMLGFIDGTGKYHTTPFREAYENGGVFTFDEVDRSDANALLAVNPHLANGVATFPDGQITRHKDCIIIATANTWGLGADANYSGATKLDAAFLSRFPMRLSWDIDTALEIQISGNEKWANRVIAARRRANAAGLRVMIDTRQTQAGAALIAAGLSHEQAAEHTYLANLKPEQRKIVEGIAA